MMIYTSTTSHRRCCRRGYSTTTTTASILFKLLCMFVVLLLLVEPSTQHTNAADGSYPMIELNVFLQDLDDYGRVATAGADWAKMSGVHLNLTVGNATLVSLNEAINSGNYDVYIYHARHMITLHDSFLPLDTYVASDTTIAWSDIFPYLRSFVASFDNVIYGIPLDGPIYHMIYRNDLLQANQLPLPGSWPEFNYIAKYYHTHDLNSDGKPDYGVCIAWADPAVALDYFFAVFASYAQTNSTTQGIYFNLENLEPLISNDAFRATLGFLLDSLSVSTPLNTTQEQARQLFLTGRCALLLDLASVFVSALNKQPISTQAAIAMVPGSKEVLDRSIEALRFCSPTLCLGTTNIAPFMSSQSILGSVHRRLDAYTAQMAYDFLSYLSGPSYSSSQILENSFDISPFRYSHASRDIWEVSFNASAQREQFIETTLTANTHTNIALGLLIPQNGAYQRAVNVNLLPLLRGEINETQAVANISQAWHHISTQAGVEQQRIYYLKSLHAFWLLPPASSGTPSTRRTDITVIAVVVPIIASLLLLVIGVMVVLALAAIYWYRKRGATVTLRIANAGWILDYQDLELLERIGVGSYGDVYRGIYRGTEVAAKKLRGIHTVDSMQQFLDEMAVMCELRHPNVLLFMGACIEPNHQSIVTEYMPRGSLYEVLHDDMLVLDWQLLRHMALDAARGLEFLHSADPAVLHRDLKSLNLLIDKKWNLKVADFGLTSLADFQRKSGGSLAWSAPEVLNGEEYTVKSDVYSYGIILWELLTRRTPFDNMHPIHAALQVLEGKRPDLPSDLNPLLRSLIEDCWHQNPSQRPTFKEIRSRLEMIDSPKAAADQGGHLKYSLSLSTSNTGDKGAVVGGAPLIESIPPPVGEVTFMFIDIFHFSQLWEVAPSEMEEAVSLYNRILCSVLPNAGGYLVKHENGAFMFAFESATDALNSAVTVQEQLLTAPWPTGLMNHPSAQETQSSLGILLFRGLRARMGIHTGEAFCTTDILSGRTDYFGTVVNIAAKVTSLAHGGDILFTQRTMEQLGGGTLDTRSVISDTQMVLGKRYHIYRLTPASIIGRQELFHEHEQNQDFMTTTIDHHHHHHLHQQQQQQQQQQQDQQVSHRRHARDDPHRHLHHDALAAPSINDDIVAIDSFDDSPASATANMDQVSLVRSVALEQHQPITAAPNTSSSSGIASSSSGSSSDERRDTVALLHDQQQHQPQQQQQQQHHRHHYRDDHHLDQDAPDGSTYFTSNDLPHEPSEHTPEAGLAGEAVRLLRKVDPLFQSADIQRWVIPFNEIRLGKKIGSGSFGEVFKATWRGTTIAVKRFYRQKATEQTLLELRKESVLMSQLRHPNVLLFLGACIVPPNLCVVTEYMNKGCVGDLLRSPAPLSWTQRIKMIKGIAQGMNYLHSCTPPVIHRDLTSYNILVDSNLHTKIADFGLSRIKAQNTTMTRCGTAAWSAPEVLSGRPFSEKSDIYSFAIILWEFASRKLPFRSTSPVHAAQLVIQGARPKLPLDCPVHLEALIKRCWKADPAVRPSFDEIIRILSAVDLQATAEPSDHPRESTSVEVDSV